MPIPKPYSARCFSGAQLLCRSKATIDPALEDAREGILAMLALGCEHEHPGGTTASFSLDRSLAPESSVIESASGRVIVRAGGPLAAVYAAATLAQLAMEHNGSVPHCRVEDAPRFGWRGLCFDVCRHFFPMKTLYRIVDLLAFYKYNRLHLHLSDDQGFRLESERFPELNRVGSWRESTLTRRGGVSTQDGVPHGGYYQKSELKELVRYAKARGVEIVPEIDLPGHALAILASKPELMCAPEPVRVATYFGVTDFSDKLFCAGREEVFAFLEQLLDEVIDVFPFDYVHIGGDEAVKDEWRRCPRCRAVMREQGLIGERALQGYFLNRVSRFLASRGKTAIVWNDGLSDNLDPEPVCQFWTPGVLESAGRTVRRVNAGGRAVMSQFSRVYFDYPYAMTPLKRTYRYEPVLRGIRKSRRGGVLGVECAVWTEWIDTEEKLFFNLLPRLAATAETCWSAKRGKRYWDFFTRIRAHYALYERLGLIYAKRPGRPLRLWKRLRGTLTFFKKDTHAELTEQKQRDHRA